MDSKIDGDPMELVMKMLAFRLFCAALAVLELYRVGQRLWTERGYPDFPSGYLWTILAASFLYLGALLVCLLRKRAGAILFLCVHLLPFVWIFWIGFTVQTEDMHAAIALIFLALTVLNWKKLQPLRGAERVEVSVGEGRSSRTSSRWPC